jgi:hypothetical protein
MSTYRAIHDHIERHPSLPPEAVIKADLLRRGISFADEALIPAPGADGGSEHQPKSYFIFSFDMVKQSDLDEAHKWRAPEEIALTGGPLDLRRTIVSVRLNPESPYKVVVREDQRWLEIDGQKFAQVALPPFPPYYAERLADGRPVAEIAPTIQWGYLIYLTVFRVCQYFGEKEECQFCDINHNYRQQIAAKRPYTGVKKVEDILAAMEKIAAVENPSRAYTLTGGSVTSQLGGESEVEFYTKYVEAIEARFPRRWIGKVVTQAWPVEDVKRLKASGAQIYHPNYEVWNADLFAKLCPGKERYIGHDEWIRRIVNAAEVFEPSKVIPNFVAGIEIAAPYGFTDVEEAVRSTGEGLDFFMAKGITPRFTTWCPEPTTPLGKLNPEGAPLEYHLRLLEVYRDTVERHQLAPPPGYGEAGPGRAVFSVSPFMDVLGMSEGDQVRSSEAVTP